MKSTEPIVLTAATFVVNDADDIFAMPLRLGTVAQQHFDAAAAAGRPITIEAAWNEAVELVDCGSLHFLANPHAEGAEPLVPSDRFCGCSAVAHHRSSFI